MLSKFPLYNSNKKIPIFLGIFSYENGINDINNNKSFNEILKKSYGYVNNLAIGKNYYLNYFNIGASAMCLPHNVDSYYNIYKVENLSYSYFISSLINNVTDETLYERSNFSFPVHNLKPIKKIINT